MDKIEYLKCMVSLPHFNDRICRLMDAVKTGREAYRKSRGIIRNEVDMVMFAVQAAIRLGKKIQAVFEDEVRDRELVLPPVEGSDLPFWGVTEGFFAGEGKAFVAPLEIPVPDGKSPCQGIYHEWWERSDM